MDNGEMNTPVAPCNPSGECLVFVYGTLRKGASNHDRYLSRARCLGPARTADSYALYLDGLPYVVGKESVCPIVGEVYGVDADGLVRLDGLEGHPNFYYREKVPVELSGGTVVEAWIYFYPTPRGRLVASGDFFQVRPHS